MLKICPEKRSGEKKTGTKRKVQTPSAMSFFKSTLFQRLKLSLEVQSQFPYSVRATIILIEIEYYDHNISFHLMNSSEKIILK